MPAKKTDTLLELVSYAAVFAAVAAASGAIGSAILGTNSSEYGDVKQSAEMGATGGAILGGALCFFYKAQSTTIKRVVQTLTTSEVLIKQADKQTILPVTLIQAAEMNIKGRVRTVWDLDMMTSTTMYAIAAGAIGFAILHSNDVSIDLVHLIVAFLVGGLIMGVALSFWSTYREQPLSIQMKALEIVAADPNPAPVLVLEDFALEQLHTSSL